MNIQTFELDINTDTEVVGLEVVFYERKVRGSDEVEYIVQVQEHGNNITVTDFWHFLSWEHMKEEHPTLKHLLVEFSYSECWEASWRQNERVLYIAGLAGHEGLYDTSETVWYDMQETVDF